MIDWSDVLRVTQKLGYRIINRKGSTRTFMSGQREPSIVTFHEPHNGQVIYETRVLKRLRITQTQLAELAQ
jgi:predicted RNA binding protein YcfA (HicA-like mRNA interferase family)